MSSIQRFSINSLAIVCISLLSSQISAARDDNSPKSLTTESLFDRWKLPALPDRFQLEVKRTIRLNPENPQDQRVATTIGRYKFQPGYYVCESPSPTGATSTITRLVICNPEYAAMLQKIDSGRWVVKRLSPGRNHPPELTVNPKAMLSQHSGTNVGIRNRLKEPGVSITKTWTENWNGEEVDVLDVAFPEASEEQKIGKGPIDFPHSARLYFTKSETSGPARMEFELKYTLDGKDYVRPLSFSYSEPSKVGDFTLPLKFEAWQLWRISRNDIPSETAELNVGNWDTPFPMEQAYLTYYGLPEPEGISRGMSWWWWVVIVALGLGVFFFWRKLRA